MNFRSYILFLLLLAGWAELSAQDFRKNAPGAGPAPKVEVGRSETFTLKNGLKGIVVENHKLPRVSFQIAFDLPLIAEGEKAGAADIAGDLIGRGTKTRKKAEIDEEIDFIGATLSTSAGGIFGSSLTKHKDVLLEVMADVLLNPTFPEEEFEKIKTQTLSSLAQAKAEPNAIASNVSNVLRYGPDHPYGELTTESTVNNITLEDARAFYDTYFQPSKAYFIVIGDITLQQAREIGEKYFAGWGNKTVGEKSFPMPQPPSSTKLDFVDKPGAVQSVITLTYPIAFKIGGPLTLPASVMNTILGTPLSGRLDLNLREDKGYTYGTSTQTVPNKYVGYFTTGMSARNEVTDSALVELLKELERVRTEPVSDEELQQAKSILAGSFGRSLEQPLTLARFALNTVRYGLPEDFYTTYLERLSKVSKEDVLEAAEKYILPGRAHIVVVGNKGEVAEKLGRFAADGEVNYYDVYGQPVSTETLEVPEGVTAMSVVNNYVAAVGGKEAIAGIEDITMSMSASIQGQNLETTVKRKAPDQMLMEMKMSGMVMMTQRFDGTKGEAKQMGNAIPLDEAAQSQMKTEARIFPEADFSALGYKAELKGVEMVEGKKAYAVEITSPTGKLSTDYFDLGTGLKIRSVSAANGNSVINDYSDYREVDGIKFPFKTTVTGMMPIPLSLEVKSIEINTGIDPAEFKVE